MKRDKPVLHGKDHAPGGADPIPAVASSTGSLDLAIAYRNGFTFGVFGSALNNIEPWGYIDNTSGSSVDLDGSGLLEFVSTGVYRVNCGVQVFDSTWTGTDTFDLDLPFIGGPGGNSKSGTWPGKTTSVAPNNPSGASRVWEASAEVWVEINTAPQSLRLRGLSFSNTTHNPTSCYAVISALRVADAIGAGVS